jgi:peroxiredoxin
VAPDFKLFDSAGTPRQLSEFRGRVVVLNFWATWCGACRSEIHSLNRIHDDYSTRGVVVLSIAMDARGWPAVTPFTIQHNVVYPVLLGNPTVGRLYGGLHTLPRTVFIDRSGRVIAVHDAVLKEPWLRKILDVMLSEPHHAESHHP